MSQEEIEIAQMDVMLRTLDGWFLLTPQLTHDAVLAWLESVECCECVQAESADSILDAQEIA